MNKNRKAQIKKVVLNFLRSLGTADLPLPIKSIVKSLPNCQLVSYSKFASFHNMSYQDVLEFAGSEDAFTDYYANTNKYLIYYNDMKKSQLTSNRYRWNIAHELGHILLEHHSKTEKSRIFRSSLSKKEYSVLEDEADVFAAYLLVPHAPLYVYKIDSASSLRKKCGISVQASDFRFSEYLKWIKHNKFKSKYDYELCHIFIKDHTCKTCDYVYDGNCGKFCPICGSTQFTFGRNKNMKYSSIDTNKHGKAIICPICSNEKISDYGVFCQICGSHITNICTNPNCNQPLTGDARFCPHCGSESTFAQNSLLTNWQYEKQETLALPEIPSDFPF